MQAAWGTVFLSLGGGLLMLHKARFPKLRYGWDVALLTYAVVSVPGACLCARKYAVDLVRGARLCARKTMSCHAESGIKHVWSDWPATALPGLSHVHPTCIHSCGLPCCSSYCPCLAKLTLELVR